MPKNIPVQHNILVLKTIGGSSFSLLVFFIVCHFPVIVDAE